MPIFFFISGYFTYKLCEDRKINTPNLFSRAKQLLIPFFVVSTLWIYYFPNSGLQSPFESTWEGLYFSVGKNGYWFTLCLFEVVLLYSVLTPILSICRRVLSRIVIILLSCTVLYALSKFVLPEQINSLIGMPLLCEFFPVFMFGVLAKSEQNTFDKIVASDVLITVSLLLGSVLMYFVCWYWEFSVSIEIVDLAKQFLYICVIIVAIAVVKPWADRAFDENSSNGNFMARLWEYLGTQSLAIYLLHYFFLFPMAVFREPLQGMNLNLVPTLIVSVFFASIIIVVTLGVAHIISKSKLLSLLLIGKIK